MLLVLWRTSKAAGFLLNHQQQLLFCHLASRWQHVLHLNGMKTETWRFDWQKWKMRLLSLFSSHQTDFLSWMSWSPDGQPGRQNRRRRSSSWFSSSWFWWVPVCDASNWNCSPPFPSCSYYFCLSFYFCSLYVYFIVLWNSSEVVGETHH